MLFNNDIYLTGIVGWIGIRPAKDVEQIEVETVQAMEGKGLIGDRYKGRSGKRDVSIIQAEHLDVVAKLLGKSSIDPALTRRNIVVSGLNLISLKGKIIQIGTAHLEVTGPCAPCSKMEARLGPGGYNAMRGHGGITCRIVKSGTISVGDTLEIIQSPTKSLLND